MRIVVTSVLVDDQSKALAFYTEVLGFVKKDDVPMGESRWLTVVSPEEPDGTELLLEPDAHPAAGPFKANDSKCNPGASSRYPALEGRCHPRWPGACKNWNIIPMYRSS